MKNIGRFVLDYIMAGFIVSGLYPSIEYTGFLRFFLKAALWPFTIIQTLIGKYYLNAFFMLLGASLTILIVDYIYRRFVQ